MSAPQWGIVEYWGPDGLAQIERDWRRLYEEMQDPAMCHSFEASRAYLEHLCQAPERFRCLALTDGEAVRAILPLEERDDRALGVPIRVWGVTSDARHIWWPTDIIGPEGEARRALLPAVVAHLRNQTGRPALLVVGQSPDSSTLWDGLDEFGPGEFAAYPDSFEWVNPCDISSEELVRRLSHDTRRTLRRASDRFESLPGARYVRAVEPADVAREFENFLDVEASGWKGAAGTAVKSQPDVVAFYRGLLTGVLADGHCEIHSLHAEGKAIASELCVYTRRRCGVPKLGYDEAYVRVSPGRLLRHKTILGCCDDPGIDVFGTMGDGSWMRQWRPDAVELRRAYVALRPVSGRLLVALVRFRFGPLRRWVRGFGEWRRGRAAASGRPRT